jgi:hypothetical protein
MEENGAEKAQACKMKFTIVIGVFLCFIVFFLFPNFLHHARASAIPLTFHKKVTQIISCTIKVDINKKSR